MTETVKRKVKFSEIVQMIEAESIADGAEFEVIKNGLCISSHFKENALTVPLRLSSGRQVNINTTGEWILADWYILEKYQPIQIHEAIRRIIRGDTVFADDKKRPVSTSTELSELPSELDCVDLGNLLEDTKFYKKVV